MLLCPTCHADVHSHPTESMEQGFIVSSHVREPGTIPVQTWYGPVLFDCHGFFTHYRSSDSEPED